MVNRKSTYGTLFVAMIGLAACRGDDDPNAPPLTGGGGGPTIGGISTGGGSTSAGDSSSDGEGGGAGGEASSSDPVCEQHLTFSCRGYRIGQYNNGNASTWNPTSDGATIQCLDWDEVEVCAPSTGAIDLQDPDDPMVQEILMRCEDACDLMPVQEQSLPLLVPGGWTRINTACVFEADPVDDTAPAGLGGFTHACGSVTSLNQQIRSTGVCDGGPGDPTECPIGSECESWRPQRFVYASGSQSIIDVDFFDALDIGTMFACDSPSFVYSSDGTGTSFIDGLERGDMLYQLGLRDGMFDFEIRKSEGSWYPLNTYAEMLTAFSSLGGVTEFELRYYRAGATKKTVTTVEVKQCGSGCDHSDL